MARYCVFNCSKMVDISELVIILRCFIINWFSQKIFLLSLKAKDTGNLFQIWWNQEALYHWAYFQSLTISERTLIIIGLYIFVREIFEVMDLMKMDMANFTIQQIRPYCQQQSVEYERKKFQDFLKSQQGQTLRCKILKSSPEYNYILIPNIC